MYFREGINRPSVEYSRVEYYGCFFLFRGVGIVVACIYKLIRSFLSSFYTFVAGCLLTSVGQDTVFEGFVDVPISNNVRIGERCHISTGVSFLVTEMGSITIGNRVYLGRNCILASDSGIEIGDNTMLAELVR